MTGFEDPFARDLLAEAPLPAHADDLALFGRFVGEWRMRVRYFEPDGTLNRWRFTDIAEDGFSWTGHESRDGGQTWFLRQRMEGERVS